MEYDETNELFVNYYKKQELIKAKERLDNKLTKQEVLRLADKRYITEEEIKDAFGFDDLDEEINANEIHTVDNGDIVIEDEEDNKIQINEEKTITFIEDSKLEDYPNQPFGVYNEDKKKEMMESIRINGIMQPLIVRPIKNGKYQILAGHNRRICARAIGQNRYPCIIKKNLSDDEAKIYLIDTNLCTRENISPMEKARAYKIKYDTYKRRNIKTSIIEEIRKDNIGRAKAELIKEEKISNGSVQRFLRLTYLIPNLQEKIDKGIIAVGVGEKISFLPKEEQKFIDEILNEKVKITEKIAQRIRRESEKYKHEDNENFLLKEEILDIIKPKKIREDNKEECIYVKFYKEEIDKYFGIINDIDELKSKIIYSLEETYIKN